MKYIVMYGGSALIGIITTLCGLGWFKDGSFNAVGGIVNTLAIFIWVVVCNIIFKGEEK